ncbi:MAG: hypothetical protein ACTIL2_13940 [Corynebacterium sp.]|uniref:hypothetical protein n=1 Tax=Corynebacterium sp. TaxID=1720 RepID=UPI003F97B87D
MPATLPARVLEVHRRTPRITVVRLQADVSGAAETGYPGQHLEVRTSSDPRTWLRLASALPPNDDGYLEFHLAHPVGSAPDVAAGDQWVVANPTGSLDVPESTRSVLMIALDGGLAALRALVLGLSARPSPPQVHLHWSTRDPADLHESPGLEGFAAGFPWFSYTPGRFTGTSDAALILVSGDDRATVQAQVNVLTGAGADPSRIIAEP